MSKYPWMQPAVQKVFRENGFMQRGPAKSSGSENSLSLKLSSQTFHTEMWRTLMAHGVIWSADTHHNHCHSIQMINDSLYSHCQFFRWVWLSRSIMIIAIPLLTHHAGFWNCIQNWRKSFLTQQSFLNNCALLYNLFILYYCMHLCSSWWLCVGWRNMPRQTSFSSSLCRSMRL